jgi:hypothetical protein
VVVDELPLILRQKADHANRFVIAQRREDPAVGAKIGMAHVGAFDGTGHSERDPAEIGARHRV